MIKLIKKLIDKYPTLWEISKFLLVGGISTLIDFFVMSLVLYAWNPSLYSNSLIKVFIGGGNPSVWATIVGTLSGFSVSLIFNYVCSIFFVFNSSKNSTAKAKTQKGFAIFAILAGIGALIHVIGMYVGFNLLNINEWIVKIFLTLVVLAFNYITRRKLIFNKKTEDKKTLPAETPAMPDEFEKTECE